MSPETEGGEMKNLLAKNWAELAGFIGFTLVILGIFWGVKTQFEDAFALYLMWVGFIIFIIGAFFGWKRVFAEQRQRGMPPKTK